MWIKELDGELEESLNDNLNFLYNSGKIFVMDNHLAAGWSWLNKLDSNGSYNLLHIDRHYDLLDNPVTMQNEVVNKGIQVHNISLQQYLDIEQKMGNNQVCPAFRWDNYILNINLLYPNLFLEKYFSTHKDGVSNEGFITEEFETYSLIDNLDTLFNYNDNGADWVVNIDLDFFFCDGNNNTVVKMFSDQYILDLFNFINEKMDNIAVLTFCLSPECCGGWENALNVATKINEVFGTDFSIT
jgi:hypothetical protein